MTRLRPVWLTNAALSALVLVTAVATARLADAATTAPGGYPPRTEASRPSASETLSFDLHLGDRWVKVTVTHPPGETAWAEWVREVVSAGVPALEQATGFPYPGPDSVRISQRETEQIHGYAGTAACRVTYCRIAMTPASDEPVLLHELAHLWTQPFAKRWLAEGYAEFASLKAAADMAFYQEPPIFALDGPSYPLSDWGNPVNLLAATPELERIESEGYFYSYQIFRLIEDAAGAASLTQTNATLFSEQTAYTVGSRLFMDTLEDTSGVTLDDLFLEWVFPEDTADLILQRREARSRLATLSAQAEALGLSVDEGIQEDIDAWRFDAALATLELAEENLEAYEAVKDGLDALRSSINDAGLTYPAPFEKLNETWDFEDARDSLPLAEDAVAAYASAAQTVGEGRSLLQRIGLPGGDPDGRLESAASHFAAGRFHQSIEDSQAAQKMVEGAGDAGLGRIVIALGVVAVLVLVAALFFWFLREEPVTEGGPIGS